MYSSEADITGVVNNLLAFYDLGVRDLHIQFDDLPEERFLEYVEDRNKFSSIGEAHLYFINEVYQRLTSIHPDIRFSVITIAYNGAVDNMSSSWIEYSRTVANLPTAIDFVWSGAKSDNADAYSELNGGRDIIVWSNYYPKLYKTAKFIPDFVYPYGGGDNNLHNHTTGHFFLAKDRPNEDKALLSWYTASDYMWDPTRYNPLVSFNSSLARSYSDGHWR